MYHNLLAIQSPTTRVQMMQTMLSSPEHLDSLRRGGVYGHILHYIQEVTNGREAPAIPYLTSGSSASSASSQQQNQKQQQPHQKQQPQNTRQQQQLTIHNGRTSYPQQNLQQQQQQQQIQANQKGNERAINYFSACLRILQLEEEVALTDDVLKTAYKKSVIRAHPDKGGSEKEFEAVTRAYAYLGDILKRIRGGRTTESKVEAPTVITGHRTTEADAWKMVEPIQLNPTKLNLDAFNTMFEKTRIPDPEESGYGDWLSGSSDGPDSKTPAFSGKFNRDVFHRAFEADAAKSGQKNPQNNTAIVAKELSLASRMGYATELGRTARDDYTVAANEAGLPYTDLKKAYTEYNTFSHQTAGVKIDNRSVEQLTSERKSAPVPLADSEMASLRDAEAAMNRAEEQRKRRVAEESIAENSYFERMKRLVIRNG